MADAVIEAEIFTKVQLRVIGKDECAGEVALVPRSHFDVHRGFQDKAGRGVLLNDPFNLREVGLDHGS